MDSKRDIALKQIRSNIDQYGYHAYNVRGGAIPEYFYTIGLSPRLGAELIIGGASYYSRQQRQDILREVSHLATTLDSSGSRQTLTTSWGDVDLAPAHGSWAGQLALGVYDFYSTRDVPVWAISPIGDARTIDVPEMSVAWNAEEQPVWRWMGERWPYAILEDSIAVTNLAAMRGGTITDGVRRTGLKWELFVDADPNKPQEGVFVVPFGTLLGFDPTLEAFTRLPAGAGLTRRAGSPWMGRHTAS